jgi:hypothetical protein
MKKYHVADEQGEAIIEAKDPKAAAKKYVYTGEWGEFEKTLLFNVFVSPVRRHEIIKEEQQRVRVLLHPDSPPCVYKKHEWVESGMHGNGGGIIYRSQCRHCGIEKIEDSWTQDPCYPGEIFRSIRYESS